MENQKKYPQHQRNMLPGPAVQFRAINFEYIQEMVDLFSRGKATMADLPYDVKWEWSATDFDWLQFVDVTTTYSSRLIFIKRFNQCCFVICPTCGSNIATNSPNIWLAIACNRCGDVTFANIKQEVDPTDSRYIFPKDPKEPSLKKRKLNQAASEYPKRLANRCFILYALIKQNFFTYREKYMDFLSKISHLMKMEGLWAEIFIRGTQHKTVLIYLIQLYYRGDYLEHPDKRNALFKHCHEEGQRSLRLKTVGEYFMNIDQQKIKLGKQFKGK